MKKILARKRLTTTILVAAGAVMWTWPIWLETLR